MNTANSSFCAAPAPMLPDGRVHPLPGTRSLTAILSGNTSIRSTNVRYASRLRAGSSSIFRTTSGSLSGSISKDGDSFGVSRSRSFSSRTWMRSFVFVRRSATSGRGRAPQKPSLEEWKRERQREIETCRAISKTFLGGMETDLRTDAIWMADILKNLPWRNGNSCS